ncbi:3' exoribonuclease family, domain containing protein [Nitzschia inconspicua]|uniref:3' exoribonuclease family, domain containing protein n=1 Tax=Nitzschia inconspicua TaxID=303405 RepID=A0A9K3PWY9_9STRA|nr:3' exoribonuclease family, domain containing protein [Nitzschia inconspicua]
MSSISTSEQQYILQGCRENCRRDGRTRSEFRPYYVITGTVALSYGSARVFLPTQETHLVVSVKAELVVPASSAPAEGVVEVSVDFLQSDIVNDALETTLSTLLVPHLVDKGQLCIAPEHYVWKINIDILVISANGGSLIDACSQGIHAALGQTMLPRLTVAAASTENDDNKPALQVDSNIKAARPIVSTNAVPVIVTISLLRDSQQSKRPILIVDAIAEEETCSFAQVHVVLDQGGSSNHSKEPMICALHKAGGGALPFALLQEVTQFCLEASDSARVVVADTAIGFKEPAVFECA